MTTLLQTHAVEMCELPPLEEAATRLFFDVVDRIQQARLQRVGIEPPTKYRCHYAHKGARVTLIIEAANFGGAIMVFVSGDAASLNAVLGLLAMNISLRLKIEARIERGVVIIAVPVNAKFPLLGRKPAPLPKVSVCIKADDELRNLFAHVLNQHRGQEELRWQVGDSFAYSDPIHGAVSIEVIIDAITTTMPGDPTRKAVPVALCVKATGTPHADEKIVDLGLLIDAYGLVEVGSRDHFDRRHYLMPVA